MMGVLWHLVPEVAHGAHAFVDGQSCYLSQIVVGVCSDGADAVGAEGYALWLFMIKFLKFLFAG